MAHRETAQGGRLAFFARSLRPSIPNSDALAFHLRPRLKHPSSGQRVARQESLPLARQISPLRSYLAPAALQMPPGGDK